MFSCKCQNSTAYQNSKFSSLKYRPPCKVSSLAPPPSRRHWLRAGPGPTDRSEGPWSDFPAGCVNGLGRTSFPWLRSHCLELWSPLDLQLVQLLMNATLSDTFSACRLTFCLRFSLIKDFPTAVSIRAVGLLLNTVNNILAL